MTRMARTLARMTRMARTLGRPLCRRPVQKSPYGTMEQSTWPVLNCALPSPGQVQFVSPAIRLGFECVHRWPQQHDLSARMASFLRFTAL